MSDYQIAASGTHVDVPEPKPSQIRFSDIAEALAKKARFNGHTPDVFYSVAQHSVFVSHLVPPTHAMQGLLHDAAEAYVNDMISPIKRLPGMGFYRELEASAELAIRCWADITPGVEIDLYEHPAVKYADLVALATEKRDLMPDDPTPWPCLEGIEPRSDVIVPLEWREARALFITRFEDLLT